MRVVVPFTHVSDETVKALRGFRAHYEDVSGSDTAYFDLLADLWADAQDFVIVEQDIVPTVGTLPSFVRCSSIWCSAGYKYLGSKTYLGLGCTRFRRELMLAHPDLMDAVALHKYEGHCLRHWCILDASMQRELWARRRHACADHALVGHLHDTPTHKCC
jgi:hypothetical protein